MNMLGRVLLFILKTGVVLFAVFFVMVVIGVVGGLIAGLFL